MGVIIIMFCEGHKFIINALTVNTPKIQLLYVCMCVCVCASNTIF